jgi:hypothetical protein
LHGCFQVFIRRDTHFGDRFTGVGEAQRKRSVADARLTADQKGLWGSHQFTP